MATGMHKDERSVNCLVLGHHDQDRKVSAKSVTMRAMTLCKNLSGYRELLLNSNDSNVSDSCQNDFTSSIDTTELQKLNAKLETIWPQQMDPAVTTKIMNE